MCADFHVEFRAQKINYSSGLPHKQKEEEEEMCDVRERRRIRKKKSHKFSNFQLVSWLQMSVQNPRTRNVLSNRRKFIFSTNS